MKSSSIMNRITWTMYLVGCLLFLRGTRGDTEVSCVYMKNCTLPCSFQGVNSINFHWFHMTSEERKVHSFYNSQDHPELQDDHFKNRTSVFQDQISRGNASLHLMGVKIQDEGRYNCVTSTTYDNDKLFVNVTVVAPVGEVKIEKVGNRLTCSSEGIYPKPELTWTTIPPSSETLQNTTTVQQNEEQLYNISSFLMLPDNNADMVYICTVSSGANNQTATWSQPNNQSHTGKIVAAVFSVVVAGVVGVAGVGVASVVGVAGVVVVASVFIFCYRKRICRKTQPENTDINMNPTSPENGSDTDRGTKEEENKMLISDIV